MLKSLLFPAILLGLLAAPGCTPTEPKATVTTSEPQTQKSSEGAKVSQPK